MRSYLPGISFLCVSLLAVFIPVARVRCNVANLAIVAWLVGSNLVHGINAIIWSDNVDIRAPVWCDIVTKLLIGASVALPGACLSISRRLELASSSRLIHNDPNSQSRRILFELLLCYVIPLLYMALHIVTQDHRFDLVKDYGCSASVHPSALGLTIITLPPLLLCFISFVLSGLAIHHSFRIPAMDFNSHITSRSPLTASIFTRRVIVSIVTSGILLIVNLFSVFSVSDFRPWISWSSVHANMLTINIVQSENNINQIALVWWGIPVVSIVYIVLSFAIGEESRDAFRWTRSQISRIPKCHPRQLMILPLHVKKVGSQMISTSRSHGTGPKPEFVDLKSGWDDMLDVEPKKTRVWLPGHNKSPNSLRTITPVPSSRVTTPRPATPTVCDEDEAFIMSTLDYLDSPAAKTLGIKPPAPVHMPPGKANEIKESSPTSVHSSSHNIPPSPRCVPTDVESMISSVFDASWPQPPPSLAKTTHHQNRITPSQPVMSLSSSSSSESDIDSGVISLNGNDVVSRERLKPLQGPASTASSLVVPHLAQRKYKRSSLRSLKRTLSTDKPTSNDRARGDVIYMTVVKESF